MYTLLQDDWALKKPKSLVFILKELPICVMQTIPFFALANQNCWYISDSTLYDPSNVSFDCFFHGIRNKRPSWIIL